MGASAGSAGEKWTAAERTTGRVRDKALFWARAKRVQREIGDERKCAGGLEVLGPAANEAHNQTYRVLVGLLSLCRTASTLSVGCLLVGWLRVARTLGQWTVEVGSRVSRKNGRRETGTRSQGGNSQLRAADRIRSFLRLLYFSHPRKQSGCDWSP